MSSQTATPLSAKRASAGGFPPPEEIPPVLPMSEPRANDGDSPIGPDIQHRRSHDVVLQLMPHLLYIATITKGSMNALAHALLGAIFFPKRQDRFFSITETSEEVSIVADRETLSAFPRDLLKVNPDPWRVMRVSEGSSGFKTGIIDMVSQPLAESVSIFYLSSYSGDYIMVASSDLENAIECLRECFTFIRDEDNRDDEESGSESGTLSSGTLSSGRGGHGHTHLSRGGGSPSGGGSRGRLGASPASHWSYATSPPQIDVGYQSPMDSPATSPTAIQRTVPGVATSTSTTTHTRHMVMDEEDIASSVRLLVPGYRVAICGMGRESLGQIAMKLQEFIFFSNQTQRLWSFMEIGEEISLIIPETLFKQMPENVLQSSDQIWSVIKRSAGPLGFAVSGIAYMISHPLSHMPTLYISTYQSGMTLVRAEDLETACAILREQFTFVEI